VNAYEWSRTNNYEPTDLVTSFHGTGVADSNDWDAYVEKCYACLPSSVAARAECRAFYQPVPEFKSCRHWHVMNDGNTTDKLTTAAFQQLACHEAGHTVGLMHPRNGSTDTSIYGCMVSGTVLDGGTYKRELRSHNISHIKDKY
jgi:hypothetical protein